MSINIPQGSLIPGDSSNSDGVFNGDVKIYGGLLSQSSKVAIPMKKDTTVTNFTVSGAVSATQLLGGVITMTVAGVSLTLPTPAVLCAQLRAYGVLPVVGDVFQFTVATISPGTMIAPQAVSGVTFVGSFTVAADAGKTFSIRLTSVSSGAETYTVYSS